jgi:hypothetical protein
VNTAKPDYKVEGFKTLGCVEYQRPETGNMVGEMNKEMEFRFVEPLGVPKRSSGEKIEDRVV